MIAKHVAMRAVRKSDFGELARYITDTQGNTERVGYVAVTNCHSDSVEQAAMEVRATQLRNTRSEADKTYHLIVSFRAGEQPSEAVLRAVEARICQGLGFGDHQRVSAAHHDTDNVHLHIAINKVHPTRYTVHAPYNDHKTLGKLCEALEKEFGLQSDNHAVQKRGAENRAQDMERHAGVESLMGWVRRECLDRINAAGSWTELHDTMREHGLELRARGNGVVITDGGGAHVKGSIVDRALSKQALEKRLGPFVPSQHQAADAPGATRAKYEKKPVRSRIDTAALYEQYQQDRDRSASARTAEAAVLRQRQVAQLDAARQTNRAKRSAIKLMGGGRATKKLLYALAARSLKAELAETRAQHRRERAWLSQQYARRAWADWLKAKASQGDQAALAALRARESRQGLRGATLEASGTPTAGAGLAPAQEGVTKKGTVIYRVGQSAVRDDGDRLQVSRGADRGGVDAALRMAVQRYGEQITVSGSDDFKNRVVVAAVRAAMPIKFSEPALERRRQALMQLTTKGNGNDEQDRRRTDGRSDGPLGAGAAGRDRAERTAGPAGRSHHAGRAHGADGRHRAGQSARTAEPAIHGKPNVGRVGVKPPPQGQNRLRNLSQLGVVQLASGSEVLLPRDVPDHMEQQGPEPAHPLRRPISRPGPGGVGLAAAEKYIAEREEKRAHGFDISKHSLYTASAETAAIYAGTRAVEGQFLALFKRGEEVEVLPIDAATARRLKRVSVGDPVTITDKGSIKTKGRSR